MYYSKRTRVANPHANLEPPGTASGTDKIPVIIETKPRRMSVLEGPSNSSSLRTLSPTIDGRDSISEFHPETSAVELLVEVVPTLYYGADHKIIPELSPESIPAELSGESHPAELADTSAQKCSSWSNLDEVIDFFVTDLKKRPQRRGATKDKIDAVRGALITELPGPRTPTLTINDEGASQPVQQNISNHSDTSVDNAQLPWIAGEESNYEDTAPLITENWDLYESPSPHGTRESMLGAQLLIPKDGQRSRRGSSACSEQYDEWQDAQEWQSADP